MQQNQTKQEMTEWKQQLRYHNAVGDPRLKYGKKGVMGDQYGLKQTFSCICNSILAEGQMPRKMACGRRCLRRLGLSPSLLKGGTRGGFRIWSSTR